MRRDTNGYKNAAYFFTFIMTTLLLAYPSIGAAAKKQRPNRWIESMVVYPPESTGISSNTVDSLTLALIAEFEDRGVHVSDYRQTFKAMAAKAPEDQPFELTDRVKKQITKELKAKHYLDGRLFSLGDELRLNIALRRSNGGLVRSRTMILAGEADLPHAVRRLVQSVIEGKQVEETLTLDNATLGETQQNRNRMQLEVYNGLMFGMAVGIGDMLNHPVIVFDSRFEARQVMIQLNLGLGINGSATYGDATIAANYYLTRKSISPYVGLGGGIFVGDKWDDGDADHEAEAVSFGGHFFPQIGIEFLRSAAIRVHVDARYTLNMADDQFGHGPVIIAGIGF